jgi:hypothetical protein
MNTVECQNCQCQFDPIAHSITGEITTLGAASGALLGARIGFLAGPVGAISGALIGGLLVGQKSAQITKCPCCDEIFWI